MGASQPSRPTGSIFLFVCISLFYVNRSNFHVSIHVSRMRKYSFVSPHEKSLNPNFRHHYLLLLLLLLNLGPRPSRDSFVQESREGRGHVKVCCAHKACFPQQDSVCVPDSTTWPRFTHRAGWSVVVPDNTSSTPHVLHHVHVQGRMECCCTRQHEFHPTCTSPCSRTGQDGVLVYWTVMLPCSA